MKRSKIILFLALCFAIVFATVWHRPVQAHEVEPETSQPKPGIALGDSPAEVVLVFPEELSEQGSSLEVLDAKGENIELSGNGVDLNDPQHATLRAGLPELPVGVYQVKWTITLTDGDSTSGSYHFGVGKVIVPTEAAEQEAAAPDAELPAGQGQGGLPTYLWVGLIVLLAAAGGVVFSLQRKK